MQGPFRAPSSLPLQLERGIAEDDTEIGGVGPRDHPPPPPATPQKTPIIFSDGLAIVTVGSGRLLVSS